MKPSFTSVLLLATLAFGCTPDDEDKISQIVQEPIARMGVSGGLVSHRGVSEPSTSSGSAQAVNTAAGSADLAGAGVAISSDERYGGSMGNGASLSDTRAGAQAVSGGEFAGSGMLIAGMLGGIFDYDHSHDAAAGAIGGNRSSGGLSAGAISPGGQGAGAISAGHRAAGTMTADDAGAMGMPGGMLSGGRMAGPIGGAAPPRPLLCGNGLIDGNEVCDAGRGNGMDGFGCRVDCTSPVCGDGHRAPGEFCDDGNLIPGDGCDAVCKTEPVFTPLQEDPDAVYAIVDPEEDSALHASEHFVLRWNDDDGVQLTPAAIERALDRLEDIWTRYIDELGFYVPYTGTASKYKVNIWVSDRGWATGSGRNNMTTPGEHPGMWLHFNAVQDRGALAHEFAHSLQYGSRGMRDSRFVGWYWESHAEFMRHQFFRNEVGCSHALVNSPHLYYGTTRNRYCNWQFTEYLAQTFSMQAVNHIWASALKSPEQCSDLESPFSALMRTLGWNAAQLNDLFGGWAMANVHWDYPDNGEVYRARYGSYLNLQRGQRGRLTRLKAIDEPARQYISPDYVAPQRWGYNLTRLIPDPGANHITVNFRGVVQTKPARTMFEGRFLNEPGADMPQPDSGWRWGMVAIGPNNAVRYSPMQAGARSSVRFELEPTDEAIYLVVTGAPTSMHQVFWDQIYYSLYRYPWRIQLSGAHPEGFEPAAGASPDDIVGDRHPNGGGFVAASAQVDETAYVGPRARVLGQARVSGDVRIEGWAVVQGQAQIRDRAIVREHAMVGGNAQVYGNAEVSESAQIYGGQIYQQAFVGGITFVDNDVRIYGDARVQVTSVERPLRANARIYGTAQLLGDIEYSVADLSQGVFYGFVNDEVVRDVQQGRDRLAPEPEVTASIDDVTWMTDRADCRFVHQWCEDGAGCAEVNGDFVCEVGAPARVLERPSPVARCLAQFANPDERPMEGPLGGMAVGDANSPADERYECVDGGFIPGVPYEQIEAPVPTENPNAVQWCQARCSERAMCFGLFYQVHNPQYAICGFFKAPIDLLNARPGRESEQVCQRVRER